MATNAVILAAVLILFTTLVNAFGVKLMARINTAGAFIELIAADVLIVLFAVHITRGPQVVLETNGTGADHGAGYLGAFLVASLASAYFMYGLVWGAGMTLNLIWPRASVYNATAPYHWHLQWGAVLFVAVIAGGGFACYRLVQRHRTGVLAEHSLETTATPTKVDVSKEDV